MNQCIKRDIFLQMCLTDQNFYVLNKMIRLVSFKFNIMAFKISQMHDCIFNPTVKLYNSRKNLSLKQNVHRYSMYNEMNRVIFTSFFIIPILLHYYSRFCNGLRGADKFKVVLTIGPKVHLVYWRKDETVTCKRQNSESRS